MAWTCVDRAALELRGRSPWQGGIIWLQYNDQFANRLFQLQLARIIASHTGFRVMSGDIRAKKHNFTAEVGVSAGGQGQICLCLCLRT
jgi:hypothetical protein